MSENPLYYRPSTSNTDRHEEFSKAVRKPGEDDIASAKAENNEENPYSEPMDGAHGGALNPVYEGSPPMRVSLDNKSAKPQGGEVAEAERNLNAYLKGANVKVRASNATQQKKFKLQRSGEKASNNEEMRSLKSSEVPPSFDNPFYSDNLAREQATPPSEDPTYSTIPVLQGGRPCLPPRTLRGSYEAPPEPIELKDEDDTYEKVNFGDTKA